MTKVKKRKSVWVSPFPGMAFPGLVVKHRFGFVTVVYWDISGEHHQMTVFFPSKNLIFPRTPEESWSASCGGMTRSPRS